MKLTLKPCAQNNRQTGIILSALLSLSVVLYSLLYFNNTYPISEGWGINYAELMAQGMMPYRDFYYYLPPLNLLIDAIFWKLSFGSLLVFRGWYLAQRVLFYVLLFRLLRKYFNQYYAFLSCLLTVILATGEVYDLIGDYNQTMALFTVLLIECAINFAAACDSKKKKLYMALAGGVFGLLFLNKQTIFAATGITFFLMLTVCCIIKKDKDYWCYCLYVAGGIMIPLGITFLYLGFNDALIPFFEQVFLNVDGKGNLFSILIQSITSRVWRPNLLVVIFTLVAIVMLEKHSANLLVPSLLLLAVVALHFYTNFMFFEVQYLLEMVKRYRSAIAALTGCAMVCAVAGWLTWRNRKTSTQQVPAIATVTAVICLAGTISICLYNQDFSEEIYFSSGVFGLVQSLLSGFLFLSLMVVIAALTKRLYAAGDKNSRMRYEQLLYIGCGSFALMYAGVMASGDSFMAAHNVRLSLPFIVCISLSISMKHAVVSRLLKSCLVGFCILLATSVVGQKIACSYSWWGSYMAPRSEKIYTVDIPAMKGMKVSADQKELYETVTAIIEENTDEDAVVWGYPHNKLFNILTERYNMCTFVPVLFYDVTADLYVEKELEMLKKQLPDVIVWQNIPYCLETHEDVFRDGELLKQRDIEAYLQKLIPTHYTLMDIVGDVTVYILNATLERT